MILELRLSSDRLSDLSHILSVSELFFKLIINVVITEMPAIKALGNICQVVLQAAAPASPPATFPTAALLVIAVTVLLMTCLVHYFDNHTRS